MFQSKNRGKRYLCGSIRLCFQASVIALELCISIEFLRWSLFWQMIWLNSEWHWQWTKKNPKTNNGFDNCFYSWLLLCQSIVGAISRTVNTDCSLYIFNSRFIIDDALGWYVNSTFVFWYWLLWYIPATNLQMMIWLFKMSNATITFRKILIVIAYVMLNLFVL